MAKTPKSQDSSSDTPNLTPPVSDTADTASIEAASEAPTESAESEAPPPGPADETAAPQADAAPSEPTSNDAPEASEAVASSPAPIEDAVHPDAPDASTLPSTFVEMGLPANMLAALEKLGWAAPTKVQAAAFGPASAGKDVLVQSQTGSGKTGAFILPWLAGRFEDKDAKETGVQLIVMTPTRELAKQVCEQLVGLAGENALVPLPVYGGTPIGPQFDALHKGVHAVVGTPGRILDHIRRRTLDLSKVRTAILDEADEMLSMGFLEDIHSILDACQKDRQTMLFSATVPSDIERIARRYMKNPESLKLSGDDIAASLIDHIYYSVPGSMRTRDLMNFIAQEEPGSTLIFCNTREETNLVANVLRKEGFSAEAISSDLSQAAREHVLGAMRKGRLRFLVATDVASRGIDITHISHVVNYSFPQNAESYVHRTGRTGRAGRAGKAVSLIGPQDMGNFYYLKLAYPSIEFTEGKLPTGAELDAVRNETKLDQISKRFPELVSSDWRLLVRTLSADPRGEQVMAYLLSEALSTPDPATTVSRDLPEEDDEYAAGRGQRDGGRGRGRSDSRDDRGRRDSGGRSRGRRDEGDSRGRRDEGDNRGCRNEVEGRGRRDRPSDRAEDGSGERTRRRSRNRDDRPQQAPAEQSVETPPQAALGEGDEHAAVSSESAPPESAPLEHGAQEARSGAFDTEPAAHEGQADERSEDGRGRRRRRRSRRPREDDADASTDAATDAGEADPSDVAGASTDAGGDTDQRRADGDADADGSEGRGGRRRRRRGRRGGAREGGPDAERTDSAEVDAAEAGPVGPAPSPLSALASTEVGSGEIEDATDAPTEGDAEVDASAAADAPAGVTEIETLHDGASARGRRRRRRRRRRGPKGAEGGGDDTTEDGEGREAASAETPSESDRGGGGEDGKGRKRRRRRRSGGRSGGQNGASHSGKNGAQQGGSRPAEPSKSHVSQDQIIIDIDESELEVVRGEFGEIDELDDLTLKGRRRGVIDALQDEVELEDMSDADGPSPSEDDADSDEDDDGTDDQDVAADAEGSEDADASLSEKDEKKKKRRRRRRRKKPEPEAPPELAAPPHKDFWEVWSAKFTYKEFEDDTFRGGTEAIVDEPDPPPAPRAPRQRRSRRSEHRGDDEMQAPVSSAPLAAGPEGPLVTVSLNVGRTHKKKAAHIRELLATEFGLEGRTVRNLTVKETLTEFRVGEEAYEQLSRGLLGYVFDDIELELTLVEAATPTDDATAPQGTEADDGANDEASDVPDEAAQAAATVSAAETDDPPPQAEL